MYRFITKRDYFQILGAPHPAIFDQSRGDLKHIQDLVVWGLIGGSRNLDIAEAGGGKSRMLRALDASNRLVNIDEFLGNDGGPAEIDDAPGVKIVRARVGSTPLPAESLDLIFSVSVVEHLPRGAAQQAFFDDIYRMLRPGGRSIHAVDFYLHSKTELTGARQVDAFLMMQRARARELFECSTKAGFRFDQPPAIDLDHAIFDSAMATNSDLNIHFWNKIAPGIVEVRMHAQSCSAILVTTKPATSTAARTG